MAILIRFSWLTPFKVFVVLSFPCTKNFECVLYFVKFLNLIFLGFYLHSNNSSTKRQHIHYQLLPICLKINSDALNLSFLEAETFCLCRKKYLLKANLLNKIANNYLSFEFEKQVVIKHQLWILNELLTLG